jgi:hypothetical protein
MRSMERGQGLSMKKPFALTSSSRRSPRWSESSIRAQSYQFKVGDINMPDWDAVKPQLEAMFLVPLQTVNIDTQVDEQIGVLVCNGHAGPNVDPVMSGWFAQELRDHGHRYEFMHLDSFANWIINDRLYNVFRAACREVASSQNKGVKKSSAAKKPAAKKPAAKKRAPAKPQSGK